MDKIIFLFFAFSFHPAICELVSNTFVRTFPVAKEVSFPEGQLMKCASQCQKSGKSCFRMNADDSKACDFGDDIFVEPTKQNVYFALDKYNETIGKESHQFEHGKITTSWGQGSKAEDTSQFPWLQVELKEEYLTMGLIIGTTNGTSHHYTIRIGSESITDKFKSAIFEKNSVCNKIEDPNLTPEGKEYIRCQPCPLYGQFIIIQSSRQNNRDIPTSEDVHIYGLKQSKPKS
ncbi:uncharacterized protein LOC141856218 isoform X2 [Brevipalpus obovatus]|uniref:uncharacterized protein LOC141856218 isoform X2 n=1 Tax=Brevipalpus obovatus TaxID=246614 RepID=UPI003D9F8794